MTTDSLTSASLKLLIPAARRNQHEGDVLSEAGKQPQPVQSLELSPDAPIEGLLDSGALSKATHTPQKSHLSPKMNHAVRAYIDSGIETP